MDILVPDSWLRNFLKTDAKPKKLAESLSLCGPSVDRVEKKGKDYIYHIEVTTNRIDAASIYGIAREANAILPRFGKTTTISKANYKPKLDFSDKVDYLKVDVDHNLCSRFTAILIKSIKIKKSPGWVRDRLEKVGVRPINNVVDISNYIMHELGQPVHTFDYNKIKDKSMVLRKSKAGEKITTLDGDTNKLPGGDIVIEDGEGRLIDLAGIMGGKNSEVDEDTKNVLLFVQTYNPVNIRKTSMELAKRTEAAVLFEKGLDEENVTLGIGRGIELFKKLADGNPEKKILDLYKNPYGGRVVKTSLSFINRVIGVQLEKKKISKYLKPLGFKTNWDGDKLEVSVPSYRKDDVKIKEDVVEEVARIYGYFKLPSELMESKLPSPPKGSPFKFEKEVKNNLKGWGGIEVYCYSMDAKNDVDDNALRIKNPLGKDSEYMRTSLIPSLVEAANENKGEKNSYHLFEMANIYIPRKGKLPNEKMTLGGIFANYEYRKAKGVIEAMLATLNIEPSFFVEEKKDFKPSRRLVAKSGNSEIGEFGILESGDYIYYGFDMEKMRKAHSPVSPYTPIPKYPAQIEDITFSLPQKTRVGDVIETIESADKLIRNVVLYDIYKDAYTFRVWYRHPKKTLIDNEVKKIRGKIKSKVKSRHGAMFKN